MLNYVKQCKPTRQKRFIFTSSIYFNGHPIWLLRTSATWDESNTHYELNEDFGYEMKAYFWLSCLGPLVLLLRKL
jgi:hypothetical protein